MFGLDLVLLAVVILSLPLCVARPWIGVLEYTWLSCMNPHRLVGGVVFDAPLVRMVAVATLVGWLFTRARYPLPRHRELALVAALSVLFTFTTWLIAIEPEHARQRWGEMVKIVVMSGVALTLMQDRGKLRLWLLVIALSFGFLGVTGGLFGLRTLFAQRLFGPPESIVSDNNALGFTFTMILPLLAFLHLDEARGWLRHALLGCFALTIMALFATYSRGSFVGFAIVLPAILALVRLKDVSLLVAGAAACAVVYLAPAQWFERMETIRPSAYRKDSSGSERMNSWYVAWRLGLDYPLSGAGFRPFSPDVYERYIPGYRDFHDAHNHFLQMLAEHGFSGLLLFLALLLSVQWRLLKTVWRNRGDPRRAWIVHYGEMMLVSFLAFIVGGIFINQPYAELLYQLIAAALALEVLAAAKDGRMEPAGISLPGAVIRRLRG
jgi:probable O-glycosylation ligase (exosortase A-associated)